MTICGCGGVGKTRVAVALASAREDAGEVWFVETVALQHADQVPARIAMMAGIDLAPGASARDLANALAERAALIVLDNCEHLVDACAATIEMLLRACPDVRVLATSREPLLVDGEALYRLGPLDAAGAALDLFVDRASFAAPDATIDRAISASIVRRLDGIPLAIELAAALARTYRPEAIDKLLARDPFPPAARRRTSVEHQRTMVDTIAWSYARLTGDERLAVRKFAAPAAGLCRDHAARLCGAEYVARLIDVSLVTTSSTKRLRMHEMTRQFALRQTSSGEADATARDAIAILGDALAAAAECGWADGSYASLAAYAGEVDNVRQWLAWALAASDGAALSSLLAHPDYWITIGRAPEGFAWLERTRAVRPDLFGNTGEPWLIFGLAMCAAQAGQPAAAIEPARHAYECAKRTGQRAIVGRSRIVLGNALLSLGDTAAAIAAFEAAVAYFNRPGDATGLQRASIFLAYALVECERDAEAEAAIARAAAIQAMRATPVDPSDRLLIAIVEIDLASRRGDRPGAIARASEMLAARGDGPISSAHVRVMRQLFDLWIADGRLDEAIDAATRESIFLVERRYDTDAALVLERCALVMALRGDTQRAARIAAGRRIISHSGRVRSRSDRALVEDLDKLTAMASPAGPASISEALELLGAGRTYVAII